MGKCTSQNWEKNTQYWLFTKLSCKSIVQTAGINYCIKSIEKGGRGKLQAIKLVNLCLHPKNCYLLASHKTGNKFFNCSNPQFLSINWGWWYHPLPTFCVRCKHLRHLEHCLARVILSIFSIIPYDLHYSHLKILNRLKNIGTIFCRPSYWEVEFISASLGSKLTLCLPLTHTLWRKWHCVHFKVWA